MNVQKSILGALALLLTPALAFAHPGHGESGLMAGISHPMGGIDHLLAMIAVGLVGGTAKRRGALGAAVHVRRHHADRRHARV